MLKVNTSHDHYEAPKLLQTAVYLPIALTWTCKHLLSANIMKIDVSNTIPFFHASENTIKHKLKIAPPKNYSKGASIS